MDNQALKTYIEKLINRGSSATELARKCGISDTAMSQFRSGKYGANEDSIAEKIASGLNYYENAWNVVESVTSYQQVRTAFVAAKRNHKWMCISSRSGSGKTQSLIDLYNMSTDNSVIYLKCRKWTARKFLTKLATCMGETVTRYMDNDDLMDLVVSHINRMAGKSPLLILDDAGKLAHSALCTLIPLYDVGRVEGYDEIDGRFCRNYIALLGATKKDVKAICAANGINDTEEQENIWGKLNKEKKEPVPGKYVWFTDDLRELSGMIEDRIIKQQIERGELA